MWNLSSLATSSSTTPNVSLIEPLESRQLLSAGPSLRLYNLDVLPSNQRMVFNRIENLDPKVPNVVHDQATLRLKNAGSKTLHITSLKIKGPWKIISAVPHSIKAHHSRNITLEFVATTPPTFSVNQTNGDINPTLGGAYTGSLTIRSNDKSHPKKVEQLAGWFQNQSENTEEPSLQTLLNTIAGFTTQIAPTNTNNLLETTGKTMYGEEVNSPYWSAANSKSPVAIQEFASWHTQGNPVNLSWYPKGTTSTQTLFVTAGNEAQTFLPHQQNNSAALAAGKFSPGTQSFGFKIDYEWSDDSRNTTGGGDGHHIRFYPVRDSAGNVVPNSYFMVLDYSVPGASVTAENYDFQDAVYILSNVKPATA